MGLQSYSHKNKQGVMLNMYKLLYSTLIADSLYSHYDYFGRFIQHKSLTLLWLLKEIKPLY